jgi:hypothetical protein
MSRIVAILIGLTISVFATTAPAFVAEITTSIPAVKAADDTDLMQALADAVDDAVHHAIGFTPTVVTLQQARLVGDRIYLLLLIVDHDGEELMKQLGVDDASGASQPTPTPGAAEEKVFW